MHFTTAVHIGAGDGVAVVNGYLHGAVLRVRGGEWAHAVGWCRCDGSDILVWCSEVYSWG